MNDLLGIDKKLTLTFRWSELLGAKSEGDKTVTWMEPEVVEKRTDYHKVKATSVPNIVTPIYLNLSSIEQEISKFEKAPARIFPSYSYPLI